MEPTANPPFAMYYDEDAYSTEGRLMGRQMAGKSMLAGVARTWPDSTIPVTCRNTHNLTSVSQQLAQMGFTGRVTCSLLPSLRVAEQTGALYYPAPPVLEIPTGREWLHPTAFSIFGITHTLSSLSVLDQLAAMVLPPFRPWDALICTSRAAHAVVSQLHDESREYWARTTGATRLNHPLLPVIPLGINAPAFDGRDQARPGAREALGLAADEIVFLFAGRLNFTGKCNPAPVYQALERLAGTRRIVCIEAGIYPNESMRAAVEAAQHALAPSVRFIWADGADDVQYAHAWDAADIFISLSDNIQETFGLTPLEAMARGLPVVVSDWDGYKDTVRANVDGVRVPTITLPGGAGKSLIQRHALSNRSYDYFIGDVSMATVVDPDQLYRAFEQLADNPDLRRRMGEAGRKRARTEYDWPVILGRYADLAAELAEIRAAALRDGVPQATVPPHRADPFHIFRAFPTTELNGHWQVQAAADAAERLRTMMNITIAAYSFDQRHFPATLPNRLLAAVPPDGITVNALLANTGLATGLGARALMWLWKFDIVKVTPMPA